MKSLEEPSNNEMIKKLWAPWKIFHVIQNIAFAVLLKKQMGLFSDEQTFSLRRSKVHPPTILEIFEAVIAGIVVRYKKGLYHTMLEYYDDLQAAFQEFVSQHTGRKKLIITAFQKVTELSISEEQSSKIVVNCAKCKSYTFITLYCQKCKNVFYCDQNCLKADIINHGSTCINPFEILPSIIEPLQLEIHSETDTDDVNMYFEHEMKYSLRVRGICLFNDIYKVDILKNKWIRDQFYKFQQFKNCIKFSKSQKGNLNQRHASSAFKEYDLKEEKPKTRPKLPTAKSTSVMNLNLLVNKLSKDSTHSPLKVVKEESNLSMSFEKVDRLSSRDPDYGAKLPLIQELKTILLRRGAVMVDILQESFGQRKKFVHILNI